MMIRVPDIDTAAGFFRRLLNRKYTILIPKWEATSYGELSEGLFWQAHRTWKSHKRQAHVWAVLHYSLGCLAIALSGFAAFGALSELLGSRPAAFITIGSGVAIGLVTFLRCDDKHRQNEDLAIAWDSLQDDITTLYMSQPNNKESQQHTETAGKPHDPDGWEIIIHSLQERAKRLSEGKIVFEATPTWPGGGEGSTTRDTGW